MRPQEGSLSDAIYRRIDLQSIREKRGHYKHVVPVAQRDTLRTKHISAWTCRERDAAVAKILEHAALE